MGPFDSDFGYMPQFDFNHDGETDFRERSLGFAMMDEAERASHSEDDYDGSGFSLDELEDMDAEDLEDLGFDPDEFV